MPCKGLHVSAFLFVFCWADRLTTNTEGSVLHTLFAKIKIPALCCLLALPTPTAVGQLYLY